MLKRVFCALILVAMLAGFVFWCNERAAWYAAKVNTVTPVPDIATLGFEPVFDYEYVEQRPGIITDRVGYSPSGKKVVFVEGSDIAKEFSVMSSDGEEIYYEGKLTKIGDKDGDTSFYLGDFSDFNRHGSFRIYQKDVGYSYIINIDDTSYKSIYTDSYNAIVETKYVYSRDLIYALSVLMLTGEIYPGAYSNMGFIKGGVELLLAQQNPLNGAIYEELQDQRTLDTIADEIKKHVTDGIDTASMISPEATAVYAGVLAQYYHDHAQDDPEVALEAVKAAGRAYSYIELYAPDTDPDYIYYAACELYRATGQFKYRNYIETYDAMQRKDSEGSSRYNYPLLADIAYLGSAFKTDYARCEQLMSKYRKVASDIQQHSDRAHFYVQDDIDDRSEDEILSNMMVLGFMSYMLSGGEYSGVKANYLHYLFGLNKDMRNHYADPSSDGTPLLVDDVMNLSKLVFIMGSGNN